MTLPEAYEFFFCDTIEEEDEEAEEAVEAPTEVQWPDVCEFFFRDSRAQRPGHRAGVQGSGPEKQPEPITIPEAYEHFLGDGQTSVLEPAVLQLQARVQEPPTQVLAQEMGPGTPRDQLQLALRQAGGYCRGPGPMSLGDTVCGLSQGVLEGARREAGKSEGKGKEVGREEREGEGRVEGGRRKEGGKEGGRK